MNETVATPVETTPLPTLAEGAEPAGTFEGSGYRVSPHLVARSDGQMVRLPPVLYRVVQLLGFQQDLPTKPLTGHQALSEVAEVLSRETGRQFNADHVAFLLDRKLAPLGVTTFSDGSPAATGKANPMLALRFRVAVFSEDFTWYLGTLFAWLFHPVALIVALPAILAAEAWLFATQDMAAALQQVLLVPAGVLMVLLLSLASAAFHETGHAAASRYGGVPPGAMGCGIYLVWPVFYTDVTRCYRLGRGGRLRTDLGGVYFNGLFIIGLAALYLWTGLEPLLVAVLISNLEIVRQLLPTLRFDGYYIVADLVGIPDLFKYIGPILKRTLLRRPPDQRLAELKQWPQRVVAVWVLVVIPVLALQLSFIALQVPLLLATAWQQAQALALGFTGASGGGPDPLETVVSGVHVFMLLLPVAGLALISWILLRGLIRVIRRSRHNSPRHAA